MPIGYRFDGFSGRLVGASRKATYSPQAFKPVEQMPVTRMSPFERPASVRTIADMKTPVITTNVIAQTEIHGKFPDTPRYRKLQHWQRVMSRNDGKLVWEKLPRDIAMYRFTWAVTAVGTALLVKGLYEMVYGTKKE